MHKGFNPTVSLLHKHLIADGEKTALLGIDQRVSYASLYENILRYASLLQLQGISRGDRVLVALPDSPEFIYAFLGSLYAGMIPVPCNDRMETDAIEFILRDSGATALFTAIASPAAKATSAKLKHGYHTDTPEFGILVATVSPGACPPAEFASDTLGFMLYTSGSTGLPKGVPHAAKDLLPEFNAFAVDVLKVVPQDILFSVSKMYFGFGLLNTISSGLGLGATIVLLPEKPSAVNLRHTLSTCRPTLLFAVPAIHEMLLEHAGEILISSAIRACVSSGECLPKALCTAFTAKTKIPIIDAVGSAETFQSFIANHPQNILPGISGHVIPPWKVRLVNDENRPVPDGQPGFLEVSGPCLFPFYWNNRKDTAAGQPSGEWYRTGDVFLGRNTELSFVGRSDDMFKSDGNWVSPVRIEQVLKTHPAIKDCGVCARVFMGTHRPFAHIVLREGIPEIMEQDLHVFARTRLPAHMCPVQYNFHEELPKTISGKIQRFRLKEI